MLKRLFQKSEFTKNTVILVLGTVLAQAIPLIIHPFLRRIYSPEAFGAMAVFLSLFSMVTVISSFRYEATIVLPQNNNEGANILGLTFFLSLFFNSIIFIALFFFKEPIINLIGLPLKYASYIYFLPITSFLYSMYQSMNYWLIRQKAFKASSINKIVRRSVEGIIQLLLGLLKFPGGLFVGDVFGNLSNVISGVFQIFKNGFGTGVVTKSKMIFVAKKYSDYPKYNFIPTLLSNTASLLPFLFINKFYSTETVGYLDLSRMVLSIPLIFISGTIAQVLYQQITEKKHQLNSIKKDLLNILYLLFGIIALESLLLFSFGNGLFQMFFGDQYLLSSYFSKILILSFSINFIYSTFSSIYMTFDKIKMNSIWQTLYFLSICSLLLFQDVDIYDFLKIYVGIEVVMLSINIFIMLMIVKKYENNIK